jgi:hypothetical protein
MANLYHENDVLIIDQIYGFGDPVLLTCLLIMKHCADDLGIESDAEERIWQHIREQ